MTFNSPHTIVISSRIPFSDLAGLDVNEINMGQTNELRIKQTTASYRKLMV